MEILDKFESETPLFLNSNQPAMPRDNFAKGGFLPAFDVGANELGIRLVLHLTH